MQNKSTIPVEPYPELPTVMDQFVNGITSILAGNLVGAYLVGSLASGDFDLDSDVDFLVVTQNELTDGMVQALQAMHAHLHGLGCYPAEHLEGSYISRRILKDPNAVGIEPIWYLDNGSTMFERSTHDNQWHVRWVLREKGIMLLGSEPKTLLPPVPIKSMLSEVEETVRRAADAFADDLDGPLDFWNSRFGQSFAVLSYCRMLHTLGTGTVQSKLACMKWALQALDQEWADVIQQAWEERKGVRHCLKIHQRAEPEALLKTLGFIRYAVGEIEAIERRAPHIR